MTTNSQPASSSSTASKSSLNDSPLLKTMPMPAPADSTPSSRAAQNAMQTQMAIFTKPASPPLAATAFPLKLHTFQITVGGCTYEVTGHLPSDPEFDKDNYLANYLCPLLGNAIEATKKQMPNLNEFTLTYKDEGIRAAPLQTTAPGISIATSPPVLIKGTEEMSKKIQATLFSPATVRQTPPPISSTQQTRPIRPAPLKPDLLPKKEPVQPPLLSLPNSSGVNCYAAALLQMISTNPAMNQALIDGLKTTRPQLSTLLSNYEEARKTGSKSFDVTRLEAELNPSGRARTQDLAELLQTIVENSTAETLKPISVTTVTYKIPDGVVLPAEFKRDSKDKTLARKSGLSESSGIPYKGLSLPTTGNPTIEQVIQHHCSLPRVGGNTEINHIRYNALHTADEFLTPPPVLVLHLQRSAELNGTTAINTTPVKLSERMLLPKCLLVDKTEPDEEYQLRSFSVRKGSSPTSLGHFVSYVKTKGANGATEYWECDNSNVGKVSQERFFEAARQANTVIYNKVAQEDRVLSAASSSETVSGKPKLEQPQLGQKAKEALNKVIFAETTQASKENIHLKDKTRIMIEDTKKVSNLAPIPPETRLRFSQTPVFVQDRTTREMAQELVEKGYRPLVLDMANPDKDHRGGGVLNGRIAQEEILCRQSNLYEALTEKHYPIREHEGIFVPRVVFFRSDSDQGYAPLQKPFQADVFVSSSGIPVNDVYDYNATLKPKIQLMLRQAIANKNDSLVLAPFGCGVHGLDPKQVAQCYKEVLQDKEFKGRFKVVAFSIIDDANGTNLKSFQEVLVHTTAAKAAVIPDAPVSAPRSPIPSIPLKTYTPYPTRAPRAHRQHHKSN